MTKGRRKSEEKKKRSVEMREIKKVRKKRGI